jgi:hypothetical protein
MIYPYFLLDYNIDIEPMLKLDGAPHLIVLDDEMAAKAIELSGDSVAINEWFDSMIAESGCSWAVGAYLENREKMLCIYEHMAVDRRYYHLGIDICAPAGTPIFSPLDGIAFETGYEEGEGNYGGYVVMRYTPDGVEPFYVMFGHMALDSLPEVGASVRAGDVVARLGESHENGGWNHHTHIQVITELGRERGYFFKGYCSESDLKEVELLCPNPLPLFRP